MDSEDVATIFGRVSGTAPVATVPVYSTVVDAIFGRVRERSGIVLIPAPVDVSCVSVTAAVAVEVSVPAPVAVSCVSVAVPEATPIGSERAEPVAVSCVSVAVPEATEV